MKKVLFTVFAVVGFNAISIANNHVKIKLIEVKQAVDLGDPCADDQQAAYDHCKSNGCSDEDAKWYAFRVWGECMGNTPLN